ncbi:acyl-CoA dehydrogenase family protein [Nocardia tengchongensis]
MQIHGGYGFAREVAETGESVRLGELCRDSKILEILEGANELQQWTIARKLIGRDVTGRPVCLSSLGSINVGRGHPRTLGNEVAIESTVRPHQV